MCASISSLRSEPRGSRAIYIMHRPATTKNSTNANKTNEIHLFNYLLAEEFLFFLLVLNQLHLVLNQATFVFWVDVL